ncbi:ABC transporter substrate-binding protein [Aerosakkonema sp. BLCC-F183]|uniref:ABC transporter substrate-binding protein n=1 Tax=Aerosakkonema sp. BLCC-F183 TaxID=3342834 RepID=UPI0035BB7DDC
MLSTKIFSPITRCRWFVVLMTAIVAISLTSCNPAQFKKEGDRVSQLVVRLSTEPKTFNYALSQESPNVFNFIYDGMIAENGKTGEIEPALAESWEISPDSKQIIFRLREGLKWSDGQPLTADDVIFTFNDIYLNEKIPTDTRDGLRIGESRALPTVKKLDDRRIEFTVPEPFAPLLRSAGGAAILPKHALEESIKTKDKDGKPRFLSTWGTDTDPQKIVSNGPYKLESYQATQRVTFRRNPYYWRHDAEGNSQPYIERIVWQIVEQSDTALIQFRSGQLDIIEIGPSSFQLLKREEKRGNFSIQNAGPDTGTIFISFNLNKGRRNGKPLVNPIKSRWFNTVAFRQAVAYGLDRQTMINNIYRGLGEPQNSPISVQSPYYLTPQEGLPTYDYNPEKAKQLLLGAGFKYNNKNQLLDADGNRVRFSLLSPATGGRDSIGSQIKGDLEKIGIQVDLTPLDFGALVDKLSNTLDWECHLLAFTGSTEPHSGFNIWSPDGGLHSFNQKPQSGQTPIEGREISDWEKKIGDLYIQAARELDEAKRKAIYGETQKLAQEYLPFIHLVNPLALAAVRNNIQDVKYSALGDYRWNVYEFKTIEN